MLYKYYYNYIIMCCCLCKTYLLKRSLKKYEREKKREGDRKKERERQSVIVNLATLGNVSSKSTCHTGDSDVRVRFLRQWKNYNLC